MRLKSANGLRPCHTCNEVFPADSSYFYQKKDGSLSAECRDCFCQRSSRNQKLRHHAGGIDYHLAYIVRGARQRARKFDLQFEIDAEFLKSLLEIQDGLCAITGILLTFEKGKGHITTNASIDRIDPLKGYTRDNVQLVAFQVNTMKSNLSMSQLAKWCRLVLNVPGTDPFAETSHDPLD